MRKTLFYLPVLLMLSITWSCEKDPLPYNAFQSVTPVDQWLVPKSKVIDAGPGKDGIPALEIPEKVLASEIDYLDENDLVIGIKMDGGFFAYPHKILDWHEIINDKVNTNQFSINYCPLTGSGTAWNMLLTKEFSSFGVSGLLYNSNLIPYDRRSGSLWSQMLMKCINGEKIGEEPDLHPIIETTWSTWKKMYPQSKVVSLNTKFNRPYNIYPYIEPLTGSDYRTDPFLIFPVDVIDERLHRKERILGITINDMGKAYRFNSFEGDISVIHDQIQGENFVVAGSNDLNFMVAFETHLEDGTEINFQAINNDFPAIMSDTEGNKWDVFGNAIDGPRKGQQLLIPKSFMAYWFAWGTFYQDSEIYGQ